MTLVKEKAEAEKVKASRVKGGQVIQQDSKDVRAKPDFTIPFLECGATFLDYNDDGFCDSFEANRRYRISRTYRRQRSCRLYLDARIDLVVVK